MKNMNRVVMVAVLALSFSGLAFSQAAFTAVKVPGASPNSPIAINNGGQVIVNSGTSDSYQVSTWGRIGGTESIGLTGTNSGGTGIDNAGELVGAADPSHSGILQAFVWRPTGVVQWLGSLGGELSEANGIGDSGAVVGMAFTATNVQHAFLWTQAGGMQDLTPDLTSVGGATALGINSSNQVVGYYYPNGSRIPLGFLWTEAAGLQNLGVAGTLPFAVNNSGTVVGQSPNGNSLRHAFSWTASGGIKDLGTLGGSVSSALGINSRGWIVGTSLTTSKNGLLHGFLWTPAAGMRDFTTVAALGANQQAYSAQVNDFGVIAVSTNRGGYVLVPTMNAKLASSANPAKLGQPVTFTVALTSIAGPPPDGETVQFSVSGKVVGSGTLAGGFAQFTTSTISLGSHVIAATYSGDANYLPIKYTAITEVIQP